MFFFFICFITFFCANYLAFFLGQQQSWSCQKRLESWLFSVCGQKVYECTVLALSLVLCQGNMFGLFLFLFFFKISCSAVADFHHTVTQSQGVTTNGSLYEPSHQGRITSVTHRHNNAIFHRPKLYGGFSFLSVQMFTSLSCLIWYVCWLGCLTCTCLEL